MIKKAQSSKLKAQNGYITITVLILMMVLVTITYLFAEIIFSELAIARNNKGASSAFSLAEAGVQEAIYKVQYDAGTRDTFLHSISGTSQFSHNPALLSSGSYSVTIQNSAKGVATITSIANYTMGLRTARREIKTVIAEATAPTYPFDGALYSHPAGGESTGDLEFTSATLKIYGGGLVSGRNINIDHDSDIIVEKSIQTENTATVSDSSVKCDCLFNDDNPEEPPPACSGAPQCTITLGASAGEMPQIDFETYKSQAIAQNQYYATSTAFFNAYFPGSVKNATINGIVYIDDALTIDESRNLVVNGVIASSKSITVGKNGSGVSKVGTLTIASPGADQPSGVLAENNFVVDDKGYFSATGLVWSGLKTELKSSENAITLIGGILSRRTIINNRTVTITFDTNVVNTTLDFGGTDTPVIEVNHWEEEY